MDALHSRADLEWRRINSQYEHLDSNTFLMMYDLWMEAFIRGHRSGSRV